MYKKHGHKSHIGGSRRFMQSPSIKNNLRERLDSQISIISRSMGVAKEAETEEQTEREDE